MTVISILRAIEKATRVVFGRRAVETGTRGARIAQNHSLDDLFHGKYMSLKYKPKKRKDDDTSEDEVEDDMELDAEGCLNIDRPVVVCRDPQELVAKVMHDRNMNPENTLIKIGADDGQGLFKLNVQLMSKDDKSENRDVYSSKSFKIFDNHWLNPLLLIQ